MTPTPASEYISGSGQDVEADFLPFHRPSVSEDDIDAVAAALRSGWLTHGPLCRQFESEFAESVGAARAVSVSSCTAAMHLSLVALGIGPGDEVITTPLTFSATGQVIEHVGAKLVLADIDPSSLQIDPKEIERRLTPRTAAILPVHYGGFPCEMSSILEIAHSASIPVVEDAAHAQGAAIGANRIGSIGSATAFSFYATKNITTGEGGMISTDDHDLADRLESLRLHGMSKDAWLRYTRRGTWGYDVVEPGFKANFTDFQAALGLSQLKREAEMRERRTFIAERYSSAFGELFDLLEVPHAAEDVTPAWHLYPLRLKRRLAQSLPRDDFIKALTVQGIGTSVHFIPIHLLSHFRRRYGYTGGEFPRAEDVFERIISLPLYPLMRDSDVERVIEAVTTIAAAASRP